MEQNTNREISQAGEMRIQFHEESVRGARITVIGRPAGLVSVTGIWGSEARAVPESVRTITSR